MKELVDINQVNTIFTRYRVGWHILFWILFVLYEGPIWGMVDGEYSRRLVSSLIELPIKITATYFTLYVLIDKFLIKKKYGLFMLFLLLSMAGFGILLRILAYYTIYPMYYPDATNIPLFFFPKVLIATVFIYAVVAIAAMFHIIKLWYSHQQKAQLLEQTAQQLEKEKLAAELKLLKSQINPHFLFNTLNNLYVLTLNNSQKAPEMVYKLSQLMSYMLYESNQHEVLLEKEVQYIRNYIALEKIRYDARLDISFNVYENIEGITIAPLLILPFVENSFKHGVSNQLVQGWIHIDITVQQKTLILKVENSKSKPNAEENSITSGIGLNNVKKRLEFLYPERYSLQLFDEEDTYLVVLKIELRKDLQEQKIEQGTKETLVA